MPPADAESTYLPAVSYHVKLLYAMLYLVNEQLFTYSFLVLF